MKASSTRLGMVSTRSIPGILPSVVAMLPRLNTPAASAIGFAGELRQGLGGQALEGTFREEPGPKHGQGREDAQVTRQ